MESFVMPLIFLDLTYLSWSVLSDLTVWFDWVRWTK